MAQQFNSQQLSLAQQRPRNRKFLREIRQTVSLFTLLPEIQNFAGNDLGKRGKQFCGNSMRILPEIQLLFLISADGQRSPLIPGSLEKTGSREMESLSRRKEKVDRNKGDSICLPPNGRSEAGKPKREVSILITTPVSRAASMWNLGMPSGFQPDQRAFSRPLRPGKTGGSWMINQDGRFVAHYEAELVGRMLFPPAEAKIQNSPTRASTASCGKKCSKAKREWMNMSPRGTGKRRVPSRS